MPAHPEWGRLHMSLSQGLVLAGDGYQNINIHLVRYPGCNSTDKTTQVPRNSQREKKGKTTICLRYHVINRHIL